MADDEVFQKEYFFYRRPTCPARRGNLCRFPRSADILWQTAGHMGSASQLAHGKALSPAVAPALFFNVVIEFGRPDKLLLVYLTPYALLLFTFCLSYRREQRKEKAASCRDTSPEQEKQTYPHYPLMTVKMTFFLLLSLAFLLPALFFVCGVAPSENSSPWWHSIIMPPFTLAGIAIPLLCGHWLASEAPFPSTFSARYLPFLLPPLLYAAFALYGLFFMDFFKPFLQYKATGMSFLLVYCLFILAFCCSKRTR